jgi:hypothetical protein
MYVCVLLITDKVPQSDSPFIYVSLLHVCMCVSKYAGVQWNNNSECTCCHCAYQVNNIQSSMKNLWLAPVEK